MRSTIIAIIVALLAAFLGLAAAAGVSFAARQVIANRVGIQQPGFTRNGPGGMIPGNPGMMPGRPGMMPGNPGMMPRRPGMIPGNPGMMPRGNNQNDPRQRMPGWNNPDRQNPMMPGNPGMMPGCPSNGSPNQNATPTPYPTQVPTLPSP